MLAAPQLSVLDHHHPHGIFAHHHATMNNLPSPISMSQPHTPEHHVYSALFGHASSFDTHRFLSDQLNQNIAHQQQQQQQQKHKKQPPPRRQHQVRPSPSMRFPPAKTSNNSNNKARKQSRSPPPCTKPGSMFEGLNIHPLFKSRLCRHYMSSGYCAYGELCRFAHGRNDLRRKGEPIEDYARRTGRDPVDLFKALAMETPHMERQEDGSMRAVAKIGTTGMEAVIPAVTKPKTQQSSNTAAAQSRVTVEEVRRARRHSVDLERLFQQQQQQDQHKRKQHNNGHKSCPVVPRRLNQHQLGLLQEELRQASPAQQQQQARPRLTRSQSSSYTSELGEIAEQLRQLDLTVVG